MSCTVTRIHKKENTSGKTLTEPVIQRKLKIGRSGDKYEQEADAVADRVMRMTNNDRMQMQPDEEEEELIQPIIQTQPVEEEEEDLQPKIQMQPVEEEEEIIQSKIQMQPDEEEEENLQMKPAIQKSKNGKQYASGNISQKLNSTKGSGKTLPREVGAEMGRKIGADFGSVRIHTDNPAVKMSSDLGAQAFTHGNDIFFNRGKYDPGSSKGRRLLAHELTHVVQQTFNSNNRLQKQTTTKTAPRSSSTSKVSIPEVPPFEVVTSTTSAGFATYELLDKAANLWKRYRLSFAKAARRHAKKRRVGASKARAAQSPEIEHAGGYPVRWSLSIVNWNYSGTSRDFPGMRDVIKAGSPFRKSIRKNCKKVILATNLTKSQIERKISETIIKLASEPNHHEARQLIIYLTGHGGEGGLEGTDNANISKERLAQLAKFAGNLGIHVMYILDTCQAGQLADLARQHAIEKIENRISGLSGDAKKKAAQPIKVIKSLQKEKELLSKATDTAANYADFCIEYLNKYKYCQKKRNEARAAGNMAEARKWRRRMRNHRREILDYRRLLTTGDDMKKVFAELNVVFIDELMLLPYQDIKLQLDHLNRAMDYVKKVQLWKFPIKANLKKMNFWLQIVLDGLGDLINELIMKLWKQTNSKTVRP